MCVQEEDRLKRDKMEVVNLVHSTHGKKNGASGSNKPSHAFKSSNVSAKTIQSPPKGSQNVKVNKTEIFKCYFFKKSGHMKDCDKYKKQLIKKDISNVFVCIESNLVVVLMNSWWFDIGYSVHITNTLQGLTNKRAPNKDELKVIMTIFFLIINSY